MVCKEDIYAWFKHLDGYKRIDFMCGLLHMCLPCEHRFLGSVVEDLGKRDYHYLRDAEIKSNNPEELRKLVNVDVKGIRSRLSVALALLHSFNTECANVLFNILKSSSPVLEQLLPGDHFAEEILLLLTMAANHPAFTLDQRLTICDILMKLQKLIEPPAQEENLCSQECNSPQQEKEKAYIKDISVRGFHKRELDRKYEFLMQVTWSDSTVTEIKKTHPELYDFHAKLIKLFPEEAGAHRQERRIPFLNAFKRHVNNRDEFESQVLPNVSDYTRRLVQLPRRLVDCDHVVDFFSSSSNASPVPGLGPPIDHEAHEEEGYESTSPRQVQNHPDLLMHVQQPMIPTIINTVSTVTTNHRHMYTCSQAIPSPHSSPLPSPLPSPHISPSSILQGSRPTSPSSKQVPDSIPAWLKKLRLHKYSEKLSKYSMEELLSLSDEDLGKEGMTCGARKKLLGEIEKYKKYLGHMNGIIQDSDSCSTCTTPPSPTTVTWHTPPTHRSYLPHSNATVISPTAMYSNSNPSSGETSPSCSEYSSPSASPLPNSHPSRSIESSGSDENDKDLHHTRLAPQPRLEHAPHRGYPYIIYPESTHFQKQIVDQCPPNSHPMTRNVRDTHLVPMQPSVPREDIRMAFDGVPHHGAGSRTSGYTSDPTPLVPAGYQVPPQTLPSPRPQFKPLPLVNPNLPYPMNMSRSVIDNNSNSTSPVPPQLRPPVPEMYQGHNVPQNLHIPMVPMSNLPVDNINKQYMTLHDTNSIPRPNSQPNICERPPNIPSPHMNNGSYPPPVMGQLVTDNNLNNKGNNGSPNLAFPGPPVYQNSHPPTTTLTVPYSPSQPPTPSHTPISQNNGCSMCGCSGDCSASVSSTPTTQTPLTYFRFPPNIPPQMGIFPHFPPGAFLPPSSNGMVNPMHNMPYPPINFPNGVTHEVLYSNPFGVMSGHQIPPHLISQMQGVPFITQCQTSQPTNEPKPVKTLSCYNCGQSGHRATECKEATMDSITHTGHYHINFLPKVDVEDNR